MKSAGETASDLKSLGFAIKSRIESLTPVEKEKIPKQYQDHLLIFIDGLTDKSLSVGGWYLDQFPNPKVVTRWFVVSDQLRVSAQFNVFRLDEKWNLQDLHFGSVHTSVVH